MNNNNLEIPLVRSEFLDKLSRLNYYTHTKALIATLDEKIKTLKIELEIGEDDGWSSLTKEKAAIISRSKHHYISIMQKQRERLMNRLIEMEKQIKIDIDSEK